MKNILSVLFLFSCLAAVAQVPQMFNYQAVARDASGNPLPGSTNVNLRFTIHYGSANGTIVYQETQATTTNQFGLLTAQVGNGVVVQGSFSGINWGSNTEYLEVEISINGGIYNNMGAAQLISVPYALYAANSGSTGTGWSDYAVYTEEVGSGDTALTQLSDTTWVSRQLNYTENQVGSSISLSGGNITVQPGTYHISASAELGFSIAETGGIGNGEVYEGLANSLLRLYNLQNDSTLVKGLSQRIFLNFTPVTSLYYIRQANSISIEGEFTISTTSNIGLQQYVQYRNLTSNQILTVDAGKPVSWYDLITGRNVNIAGLGNEIYARISIQKIN